MKRFVSAMCDRRIPEPNTDKEINFLGLEWYTDFPTTIKALENAGLKNYEVKTSSGKPESEMPFWNFMEPLDRDRLTGENCGIRVQFKKVSNVADHKVSYADIYMMLDQGTIDTYKRKDAVKFYMAVYYFDTKDDEACYFDLFQKLQKIYGSSISYGSFDGPYAYWVNYENAVIRLQRYNGSHTYLAYMAPNSTQELEDVDKRMNPSQPIRRADPNDYTGL